MAAKTLVFDLTPEQLAAKQQQLVADGVTITLPSGTIEHDTIVGCIKLAYTYDAANERLSVTIVECPWLAEGRVVSEINQWFAEA